LVPGSLVEKDGGEVFLISPNFDFRALPGYAIGSVPKDEAQIPYHKGGNDDFELGAEVCP